MGKRIGKPWLSAYGSPGDCICPWVSLYKAVGIPVLNHLKTFEWTLALFPKVFTIVQFRKERPVVANDISSPKKIMSYLVGCISKESNATIQQVM